jgi:predicted ArsR family transcriptional regulator
MSVEAIGVLHEPVRRAVYEYTVGRGEPVGRNDVAEALGIGRTLAAFHLDRLAEAGLLEVSYARRSGRTGPGAGRPAKLYRRSTADHEVTLPPRRYQAAAELLADAVERAGADDLLFAAARRRGRSIGSASAGSVSAGSASAGSASAGSAAGAAELIDVLTEQGYEPERRGDSIVLRNCPFHALARDFPPLVCGMNLALLEGLVEGLAERRDRAPDTPRLAPAGEGCCVVIDLESKNNRG